MANSKAESKKAQGPGAEPKRRGGRPRDPTIDRVVLEATLSELREQGFGGMSVDRVAERSGVGKAAIYRRYKNKPAIAVAALEVLAAKGEGRVTGNLIADLTAELAEADANLESAGSMPLLGTLLAEMDRHPDLIGTYRERLVSARYKKLHAILTGAIARKEVRADADVDLTIWLLLGFLASNYIYVGRPPLERKRIRAAVEQIVASLLR